ncbi:Ig-like domain repeat protein [Streptomyces sp. NRRL S-337]|uniref:Ig-like domain repeat protein n=1 Tax=Streptomyces sp. NRRL S-337 TaxID=1463900 RepID=UPI00056BBE18|nr:Ig-like domain repeat protein [Streptomyces sp. NRRL S-337]
MLTPERPNGAFLITDRDGNCLAVVDPASPTVVPTLNAPVPLAVRGAADQLVLRTSADRADLPRALDSGTLLHGLPGLLNRPAAALASLRRTELTGRAAAPGLQSLSGVFPDQGPYSGGTLVTIIGRRFTGATAVYFGTRRAASFAVLDDRTIVAVTPPGAGAVPVTVTAPGGSTRIGYFFYLYWPSISRLIPTTGPVGGGNVVELVGVNLRTALLVRFGDAVAFPTAVSDSQLLVTAPPVAGPGTVPVSVTTLGGVSNRLLYTYVAAPSVTGVSPSTGPIEGGTTLVVSGTGLSRVTEVTVDGVPAVSFRAFSDSLLLVVTPPGTPGPADLVITTPGGSVTVSGGYGYQASTRTTVSSAPDPSVVGQAVALTAVVTGVPPTTGTPSGTVTFDFGDGSASVPVALTGGTATVSHVYTAPSETPYQVTASYGGDVFFTVCTGTTTQVVEAASTTTSVRSAPDPSLAGQSVTLVARVAPVPPGDGKPTGTVIFDFGDGTPTVTAPLVGGAATVGHTYTDAAGTPYAITADYSGDTDFTASTGTDTQTVQQAASAVGVSVAPNPTVAGQPVTASATVTAVPPGAGTPTGTVTFDFGDGTPTVTTPLTGGTASVDHAYADASATPYTVTVTYSGDSDLTPSTGTATQTVGPASSTTAVTVTPDPATVGEPVTFGATVTAIPPGAATPTGTVTFDFGDGTPTVTLPLADGAAATSHTYTGAAQSPYTVTATYNGDADVTPSVQTVILAVQPAGTTTTLVSTPDPSPVGQEVTFSAAVTTVPPGAGTPTGTVTFDFGDDTPTVTAALTDGTAQTTHPYGAASDTPYQVTATYQGDADFTASSGIDAQTVEPADTATALTSVPDPSTVGQSTTFVAKIIPETPAAGSPTGTVTFEFSDDSPPVTAPVTGGTATVSHTNPEVSDSPYTVAATYSGDDNFNPSAGADSQVVTKALSMTTVSATPAPSVTGQTVTFSATVQGVPASSVIPTGTVTFDFGDGSAPVTVPLTGGTAGTTHAYINASQSPYAMTVSYSGDINFTESRGSSLHSVEQSATVTTVTAAPDPSVTGEAVTVTVSPVAPGAGIPTGEATLDFGDGSPILTARLVDGSATVTHVYTSAANSPYTITAHYSGDGDFAPSDDTLVHTVTPAATTTTVTSSASPSAVGQTVTLIARVTPVPPGAGAPSGSVTFDFGDGSPTVTAPVSGNLATVTHAWTSTSGSPYTVTASYAGDGDFAASVGTAVQSVATSVSTTSTTVSSSPEPSVVGGTVTFTAAVAVVPPASGTPAGSVTFEFGDGSPTVAVPLAGGTATATHAYAAAGSYSVTAVYSGDADFAGSSGLDNQTVDQAGSTTTPVSAPDPSATGEPVTFTATVASTAAGAGTPTGYVTFDFGDGSPAVRAPLADGTAVAVHPYTRTAGSPYTVTATYNGDANLTGSSGTDTQTVNAAATATTVVASPHPSSVGQPVTLTAAVSTLAPATGEPTGTVTFDFGDGSPAETTATVAGLATVVHAYTTTGGSPYTVTATYHGTGDFQSSTVTITQAVVRTAATLTVSAGAGPSVVGEPVTVAVTAAAVPPGAGVPTGTLTVDFGDGTPPATAALTGGSALFTHAWTSSLGSPYAISAVYNGSDDFTPAVAGANQTVLPVATTTTVAAGPEPSVAGQPVTFTATVAPVAPGAGTPTGTLAFDFGDGTPPVAVPVVAGVATAQHAFAGTAGSPYTVTAAYGGAPDFTASADTTGHAVGRAASEAVITMGPDTSVSGQPVTVTATVTPTAPGDGTPTGTVTVDFGDGTAPVAVPLVGGAATVTHTWAGAAGSPYVVTASYGGDADFGPTTATAGHPVAPAASTTSIASVPNPAVPGQPVAVTATVAAVAPGDGTPTGTVTFDFGDGSPSVTAPLTDGTATATHAWTTTAGSPYPLTATYNGDADFTTSGGASTLTVGPGASTTSVSDLPEPSVTGGQVSFFARVTPDPPGAGVPTGTVAFDFGDGTAPVVAPLSQGLATTTHAFTGAAGPYTVTAHYSGDDDFTASAGVEIHTVQPALTTTVVDSSPDPSVTGQPVTVTAAVTAVAPGAGTPTGTVTFAFGDGSAPVAVPLTGGTATVPHTWTTTVGSPYAVTATYGGDAGFTASSGTATQTVTPAATVTSLASSPDPSVPGRSVDLTATVAPVAPGTGTPTGTVTFDFGDGTPSVVVPLTAGTAATPHTWTTTAGSPYALTATYNDDGDFDASTGTDTQTVGPVTAAMTLFSSPTPSTARQNVTFTARISAVPPGAGAPTGTVTFDFGDGTAPATAPVLGGVATADHAYATTAGSPYQVTASYSGDPDFTTVAATAPHAVTASAATTSTTVTSSPDPTVTGQPVTFTATVAPTPNGGGVPTGTVTFDFGDGTAAITAPLSGGGVTVAHTYTRATGSPYGITARYSGDANFSSSSGTDTQTVLPAATTTTPATTPDPSVTGQPVTLTATVAPVGPGAGVPTGTVTFDFGDGSPAASAALSGGVARIGHTYSSEGGPYTVTASYNGDTSFIVSTGTDLQTVGKAATTTAVVSSPDPTVVGQPTTLTATVAPAAPGTGTPTGTVTFDFGDGSPTVTAPLSNGLATTTHTYTATSGSPYAFTGTYNGDTNYTTSSGIDTQTVGKAATTTAVVSSPDPTVVGQPTTLTATVAPIAPGTGTPTGTVTFDFGDGTSPATATLSGGVATITHTYTGTSGSPHTFTGTYNGDSNYTTSHGVDTQTVNRAATTTSLVSVPDPGVVGQPVTLTATVAPVAPGTGSPTGTVTFTFGDGAGSVTATLSGGVATVTHTWTTRTGSPFTVTAAYNGDTNFTTSSGTDTQTVNRAATTTTVTSSPDPSVAGQSVTLTATVDAQAPGAGTPTGTVTFSFGDGTGTATATLTGGVATLTHTYAGTSGSPFTVTAGYNGDANYATSSGTDAQTVNKAATTTTVTSAPDPSAAGQSVTLTATVAPVAPGTGSPTGTVTFTFGDGTSSATAPVSGGVATLTHTWTTRTGSPFTVTATYNGDTNFTTSTGTDTQTLSKLPTTTTVTSTPDPSVSGQPVTIRATVSATSGTPTGTVTFTFGDGTNSATAPVSGGVATITHTYSGTTGSPFTLSAAYGGDASFAASTGTDPQTVNRATTSTVVVSTPNPSTTGDTVTVTATVTAVSPGTGTPTGTVALAVTGRTPQIVTLVNGRASAQFNPLPKGTHLITGNYNGDVSFAPSSGSTLQTVSN